MPWVVGAFFLVRRAAWDAIGGLDENYALYFEDVDLCWRLRQAGWRTRLDRDVHVEHKHGAASRKSLLGRAARLHVASAARFYRTNPRFILSARMPAVARPASALPARAVQAPAAHVVPVRTAAAGPAPAAPAPRPLAVGVETAMTPDLLGSFDYWVRRWSPAPVDPAPPNADRLAAARWAPHAASHSLATVRRESVHADASRWLPGKVTDAAVAA